MYNIHKRMFFFAEKRNQIVLLLSLNLIVSSSILAQFTNGPLPNAGGTVCGPVKKVTVIVRQTHIPEDILETTVWFDSICRIEKVTCRLIDKKKGNEAPKINETYQYVSNDFCWHNYYDENGIVSSKQKILFNSKGQEFLRLDYHNSILTFVDSCAYDKHGRLIETYKSEYKDSIVNLVGKYSYDSAGRIIEYHNVQTSESKKYKYLSTGNYIKYSVDFFGKSHTEKYTVNKKGQVVKEKSDDGNVTTYSHYDKYGNWQKRESYIYVNDYGKMGTITERKIEYYE